MTRLNRYSSDERIRAHEDAVAQAERQAKAVRDAAAQKRADMNSRRAGVGRVYKTAAECQSDAAVERRLRIANPSIRPHEVEAEQAKARAAIAAGAQPETTAGKKPSV